MCERWGGETSPTCVGAKTQAEGRCVTRSPTALCCVTLESEPRHAGLQNAGQRPMRYKVVRAHAMSSTNAGRGPVRREVARCEWLCVELEAPRNPYGVTPGAESARRRRAKLGHLVQVLTELTVADVHQASTGIRDEKSGLRARLRQQRQPTPGQCPAFRECS